ncbi:glycosyltransferase family 2 protein [Candidatus Parcubacteria bacterium]|nr:glycosyltransferase family 2 protein [Candidatus Parcubacteria bacterium]
MRKLISIIIPTYNEAENIPFIHNDIKNIFKNIPYRCEMIFVNDGSFDKTQEILKNLAGKDRQIKYLEFSRNFGKEMATTAGINRCKGDACLMIDADLQHPVKLIPKFIEKWEAGAETVIGIRRENNGEGIVKRFGSFLFYKFMNSVGETKIIPNATDFRLIDRKIVNEFNKFTEGNRITRGLLDWLGFKKDFVYFKANKRMRGKAGYNPCKLFGLTVDTLVGHSLFLLKLVGKLGVVIVLISGFLGIFIFIEKYILNDPLRLNFSGPAILAVIILFLIGIVLVCLGLIALYIGNIQNEVANRPLYVISKFKV